MLRREVGVDAGRTGSHSCSPTSISSQGECILLLEMSGKIDMNRTVFFCAGSVDEFSLFERERVNEGNVKKKTNVEKMGGW